MEREFFVQKRHYDGRIVGPAKALFEAREYTPPVYTAEGVNAVAGALARDRALTARSPG